MAVKNTVSSKKAIVMMTDGQYLHHKDPVVKTHNLKDQKDTLMAYLEVSNLKKVQHYIDGGFMKYNNKFIVVLLLENQGRALREGNEDDVKKYDELQAESAAVYLENHNMRHMYV